MKLIKLIGKAIRRIMLPPPRGDGLLRDTAWNAVSNVAAALMTFVMLILTSHISGAYLCGVAALGLSMSQQLFPLGNFTMGNYQASDIGERYAFGDYVASKMLTVTAMLAVGAIWVMLDWRGGEKAFAFLAMAIYQASEAFSNSFFSRYQQKGRLDAACRIRFVKTIAFILVYAGVLAVIRNPLPAMLAAAVVHALLFWVLDMPMLAVFGPLRLHLPGRNSMAILVGCLPLAVNSLLSMVVNNNPRFAVDSLMGAEAMAAFSALFMVSFAVAVCAEFLMNPQVVRLAEALKSGNRKAALRTILAPLAAILGLGVAGVAFGAVAGIPLLSFLFGIDLSGYKVTLCLLLVGGVLFAIYQLSQTILVVLRHQMWGMPGMVAAALFAMAASRLLVASHGLRGAALTYLGSVGILSAYSSVAAVCFFKNFKIKK